MYIIIGQGAAGTAAANTLRQVDPATPVTMITDELDYFYSRIDLPDIIAGKYEPAAAELQSPAKFSELNISCRMGERVAAIFPDKHEIELASGERLSYTKLLLATGSSSFMPPLAGCNADGMHVLWTMAQADSIIQAADSAKSAVVIGAGLIGIKTALALKKRGLTVTLIEKLPRLLPRQLDELASVIVAEHVQTSGVQILTGTAVEQILTASDGKVAGVKLPDRTINCDMVVMAVGVKANTELAFKAGITVRRGIVADEYMHTSMPDVYVAGDAAEVRDALTGEYTVSAIWPEAVEQGQIAARNMAGGKAAYTSGTAMNSVEVAGVPLVSVGDIEGGQQDEILIATRRNSYRKIVIRDGVVRGMLCVGDINQAGVLAGLVLRKAKCEDASRLLSPAFGFASLLAM